MKGSIHDTRGGLQTNGNVFWIDKFASNILSYDE